MKTQRQNRILSRLYMKGRWHYARAFFVVRQTEGKERGVLLGGRQCLRLVSDR